MIDLNQKRLRVLQNKFLQPSGDPAHRLFRKRTLRPDSVLLPYFLLCIKNTGAWPGEVYLGICSFVWLQKPGFHRFTVTGRVFRRRPYNRLPVASGNQKQAFPHCRRSIICRRQLPALNFIAESLKLPDKPPEGFPLFLFDWPVSAVQRPPVFKFLHIFQYKDPRTHQPRPSESHPCKAADIPVLRFSAFGLAEMLAVRRKPGQRNRTSGTGLHRIYSPDRLTVMPCPGMVRFMHPDRFRVMVDCYINTVSGRCLNPGAGSASSGKIVHDQFSVYHFFLLDISCGLI